MGKFLSVKVTQENTLIYKNKVNFYDPNLLILIFEDLESFGFPMEKLVKAYLKKKTFPINV